MGSLQGKSTPRQPGRWAEEITELLEFECRWVGVFLTLRQGSHPLYHSLALATVLSPAWPL